MPGRRTVLGPGDRVHTLGLDRRGLRQRTGGGVLRLRAGRGLGGGVRLPGFGRVRYDGGHGLGGGLLDRCGRLLRVRVRGRLDGRRLRLPRRLGLIGPRLRGLGLRGWRLLFVLLLAPLLWAFRVTVTLAAPASPLRVVRLPCLLVELPLPVPLAAVPPVGPLAVVGGPVSGIGDRFGRLRAVRVGRAVLGGLDQLQHPGVVRGGQPDLQALQHGGLQLGGEARELPADPAGGVGRVATQ